MLFMQAFWDNGVLYIYDIGYRLTGTQEYHILENICGFNPLKMLVNYALTGKMLKEEDALDVDPLFHGKKAAIITYLMKPGKIGHLIQKENNELMCFIWNHNVGDEIIHEGTLTQIIARAYLIADEDNELNDKIERAKNIVSVLDVNNCDLLIPYPC